MPASLSCRAAIAPLLALTTLAYANAFWGAFQFDDIPSVLGDYRLESPGIFISHLDHMVRPFLKLTLLVDRQLYRENPAGYHLLNLLLHLASGALLYRILCESSDLRMPGASREKDPGMLAFWTALLFLTHPIQTETVTYISGRATGLMTLFYLAALYLFIRSTGSEVIRERFPFPRYLGALLCFGLSLLSKEVAVTLPAALLLWDAVLSRHRRPILRATSIRPHLPFWGVLLLLLGIAWSHPRYSFLRHHSLGIRPIYDNLLTQINTVAYVIILFLSPKRLNFDHDLPIYHSIWQWPTPLSLAMLIGLIAAAVLLTRRAPLFSFGLLWFFLTIAPTNSLIPRQDVLSERNLYLPSIGFFLAIASLATLLAAKVRTATKGCFPGRRGASYAARAIQALPWVIIPLLIGCTLARNTIYVDQLTFWTDAVRKSPYKARPHNNLGYAYYMNGDADRAVEEFRIALSLDPGQPRAQQNLLRAWDLKKNPTERTRD